MINDNFFAGAVAFRRVTSRGLTVDPRESNHYRQGSEGKIQKQTTHQNTKTKLSSATPNLHFALRGWTSG